MCDINLEGLEDIIHKTETYLMTDSILKSTKITPFWVKDVNFRFLRVNQATCDLMYPNSKPEDLIGYTDQEYAKRLGCSDEVAEHIKTCCSFSDNYMLNKGIINAKFFEQIRSTDGSTSWILCSKEIIPPVNNKSEIVGVYGTAIILPNIDKMIESGIQKVEQLSDYVYRLIE